MLAHAPPPRILFIEPSTHHYLYCAPRIRRSAVHITIRHTFLPPSTIITRKALRHSLHQIFVDQIRSKIEKRVRYLAKLLYAPRSGIMMWVTWLLLICYVVYRYYPTSFYIVYLSRIKVHLRFDFYCSTQGNIMKCALCTSTGTFCVVLRFCKHPIVRLI